MGIKAGFVRDEPKKHFQKKSDKSANKGRMQFIPSSGITVRFLTGSEDWVYYQEYWDGSSYVIATEENEDEFKERDVWPSNRYLAAAVDTADNRVMAIKLPKNLAADIKSMEETYGKKKGWELSNIDLELTKEGSGMDTVYRATFMGADDLDISRYDVPDLFAILEAQIDDETGDDSIPEEQAPAPAAPAGKKFALKKGAK